MNRIRRHNRIRAKVKGTKERPRFAVYKSNRYLEAQLIDDLAKKTLVSASTRDKEVRTNLKLKYGGNVDAAKKLGGVLAEKAKAKGVNKAVFDRAGYLYHGRVKALAEGAREGGLAF